MKNPRLEIGWPIDPASFNPRITVNKDGERWFSFSSELISDIQHGDWFGMFGPAQRAKTLEDTFKTLTFAYQNEFPDEKELVAEAMTMICDTYKERLDKENL